MKNKLEKWTHMLSVKREGFFVYLNSSDVEELLEDIKLLEYKHEKKEKKYPVYHNTNGLSGKELEKAIGKATSIKRKVYEIFSSVPDRRLSVREIFMIGFSNTDIPEKSIRPRVTELCKMGVLVITEDMGKGIYGAPEHYYKLNR